MHQWPVIRYPLTVCIYQHVDGCCEYCRVFWLASFFIEVMRRLSYSLSYLIMGNFQPAIHYPLLHAAHWTLYALCKRRKRREYIQTRLKLWNGISANPERRLNLLSILEVCLSNVGLRRLPAAASNLEKGIPSLSVYKRTYRKRVMKRGVKGIFFPFRGNSKTELVVNVLFGENEKMKTRERRKFVERSQ